MSLLSLYSKMKSVFGFLCFNTVAFFVLYQMRQVSANWQTLDGTEYYISKERVTYPDAMEFCESMDSYLLSIQNEAENTRILNAATTGFAYWIGLKCDKINNPCNINDLRWLSGAPLTFFEIFWICKPCNSCTSQEWSIPDLTRRFVDGV